jgi:cell division protein DivIC
LSEMVMNVIPKLRNKFVISFLVFLTWMTFFDENSFISTIENRMKLAELEDERDHYLKEIAQSTDDLKLLQNNQELLEKFARERYLMKKENEDIFIFSVEE